MDVNGVQLLGLVKGLTIFATEIGKIAPTANYIFNKISFTQGERQPKSKIL
jgi:hypothetical protein